MKKIALACTGGGIKACVNIGVLRALEELNIEIEAISGASMGAIVVFLYLCGYTPEEILKAFETEIYKSKRFSLVEKICAIPRLFILGGAKNPKKVENFLKKVEQEKGINSIGDIKIPFIIPTLDISKRKIAYYSSKPLREDVTHYCDRKVSEAIRCSAALPLLYNPNKVVINNENHFMLDGGILTNTLVTPLKDFSDYVIGVTNKFYPKQRKRINLFTGFVQTWQSMRRESLANQRKNADLWIEMETNTNDFSGKFSDIKKYEELGYNTAMKYLKEHLPELQEIN